MATRGGRRHHRRHRRSHRRGGNALGQAIVPFGLFALSNYLGTGKKHHRGTRKGMRRKTARKAYMKKGKLF